MTTHTSTASTRAHAIAQPPENSDVIRHVWRHKYYDIIALQYMYRFVFPSSATVWPYLFHFTKKGQCFEKTNQNLNNESESNIRIKIKFFHQDSKIYFGANPKSKNFFKQT